MSEHMRKRPTSQTVYRMHYAGAYYEVPKRIAERYRVESNLSMDDVVSETDRTLTKAGALLKGVRYREAMTQITFAKKIGVTQGDLSKMENGKRPIGKKLAKRIAALFDVDYRYFLE